MWTTHRLRLVPATLELSRAEIGDRERFARLLGAEVPANWPPESSADALEYFLDLLQENPAWEGWLAWYAVASDVPAGATTLVGSVGFKGAPDAEGRVEMGYSVLPQFQRRGLATEMARGVVEWAASTNRVTEVLAQTTDENAGSRAVLRRLGFRACGPGTEPDHVMYRLGLAPPERTPA
jgi:ribosomal-protein-alanine N-acetyltransferase